MPFDDARKLAEYQAEFEPHYFVSNYLNDDKNKTTKVSLIDNRYKCKVVENGKLKEICNVCMDIYPYYNCPPSRSGLLINIWRSHNYKLLVGGIPKNHGILVKIFCGVWLCFFPKKKRSAVILRIEDKLNYKGNSYEIADYYGYDISLMSAITYKSSWFAQPSELEFEGRYFLGPTEAEKYLTKRYGNYLIPASKTEIEKEAKLELLREDE